MKRGLVNKIITSLLCLLLFGTALFVVMPAQAITPVIKQFQSEITVNPDASLLVTETIAITTDAKEILHGIYRDFPTDYQTRFGLRTRVPFKVVSAMLDGQPVNFSIAKLSNGVRVYLGNRDQLLAAREHTFVLTYKTSKQLGLFSDHDELYWNVTGNAWRYPINSTVAMVKLPEGALATITGQTAYHGYQGSKDQADIAITKTDAAVVFSTNKPLLSKQGLTIVVGWKKGFITLPLLTSDNLLLAGFVILLLYYLLVWFLFGRDPKRKTIIPEYTPPLGFSPAALRYILKMGYDIKVFAAAILNLAVQGFLRIEETANKKYLLRKQPGYKGSLSKAEERLGLSMFALDDKFDLSDTSGSLVTIQNEYKKELRQEFASKYFATNLLFSIIGVVLWVAILLITGFATDSLESISTTMTVAVPLILIYKFSTQYVGGRRVWNVSLAVIMLLFLVFLNYATFPGFYFIINTAMVILVVLFWYLLKRPTAEGQKLDNHTRGFKLFLEATEKDRMNFRNPPERTPELYEKYLPYAVALGVEQRWGEQFTAVLTAANYQPTWYSNAYTVVTIQNFTTGVTTGVLGAVSAASSSPGSSSGFSGGSSGGGGGGGGGGGW